MVRKNYRPVSCFTFFSKVFEGVMCDRIFKCLTKFSTNFSHCQGFIKKRSSTGAILEFCDQCYNSPDSKKPLIDVFFSLPKVSDAKLFLVIINIRSVEGREQNANCMGV